MNIGALSITNTTISNNSGRPRRRRVAFVGRLSAPGAQFNLRGQQRHDRRRRDLRRRQHQHGGGHAHADDGCEQHVAPRRRRLHAASPPSPSTARSSPRTARERAPIAPRVRPPSTRHGFNFLSSTANCTLTGATANDTVNATPLLGALANNGGPQQTVAIQDESPVIDTGGPSCATGADQRGVRTADRRGVRSGRLRGAAAHHLLAHDARRGTGWRALQPIVRGRAGHGSLYLRHHRRFVARGHDAFGRRHPGRHADAGGFVLLHHPHLRLDRAPRLHAVGAHHLSAESRSGAADAARRHVRYPV